MRPYRTCGNTTKKADTASAAAAYVVVVDDDDDDDDEYSFACPSVTLCSISKTLPVANLVTLLFPLNATQKCDCHIHRSP
jgi:hypothetical protein